MVNTHAHSNCIIALRVIRTPIHFNKRPDINGIANSIIISKCNLLKPIKIHHINKT